MSKYTGEELKDKATVLLRRLDDGDPRALMLINKVGYNLGLNYRETLLKIERLVDATDSEGTDTDTGDDTAG